MLKFIEVVTATGDLNLIRVDRIEAVTRGDSGCKIFFTDDLSQGFEFQTSYEIVRDQLNRNGCYDY